MVSEKMSNLIGINVSHITGEESREAEGDRLDRELSTLFISSWRSED